MSFQTISSKPQRECSSTTRDSSNRGTKESVIANLAQSVVTEVGSVLLLSKSISFCSLSTSFASLIPQLAFGVVIANSVCKVIRYYFQYRDLKLQEQAPKCLTGGSTSFKTITQWVPPLNFAFFFGTTGNLLIHEGGHISMASLVYRDLKAQITIPGFFRGAVSWTKTGFTPLGSSLGGLNSRLLVCVAGPLLPVLAGTVALVAGIHFKDRFPELSKYLTTTALFTIVFQVLYALSAFWASGADLSHDFVMLQHIGVNPVIASLILASIPLIALATYFRLQKTRSE